MKNNILFLLLLIMCSGCSPKASAGITLMTYNVHNLFDTIAQGTEYEDSDTPGKAEFQDRCYQLAQVILGAEYKPDVIAVQEVESRESLDGLVRALGIGTYGYTALGGGETVIRCGLISRWPLVDVRSHVISSDTYTSRAILEATVVCPSGKFAVFVVHLKSAREGSSLTEPIRLMELENLKTILQNTDLPFVVLGDFNEDPYASRSEDEGNPSDYYYGQAVEDFERNGGLSGLWQADDSEGTYWYGGQWLKIDRLYYEALSGFFSLKAWKCGEVFLQVSDHRCLYANFEICIE